MWKYIYFFFFQLKDLDCWAHNEDLGEYVGRKEENKLPVVSMELLYDDDNM